VAGDALDIWMNGEPVGVWTNSRNGIPVFQYRDEWLRSPRVRPLSLSLPIVLGNPPHRGADVSAWFDNLLPDSAEIRARLARRFQTGSAEAFDLLAAIGRDCVGACQIVPEGMDPGDLRQIEAEPMDDGQVARILRGVTAPTAFGLDDEVEELRISIAGAQEKLALLRLGGQWCLPRGATPTSHILKLPLGLIGNLRVDMRDSVENEWLCMQLLGLLGLPVPATEIAKFRDDVSEERALVIERFDRQFAARTPATPAWIVRLPQEDFCQATGTPRSNKYEADGGPGIQRSLELLAAGDNPREDASIFACAQLAFWLLAAPDGHAKNFSIFLKRDDTYGMTPLYDVLSAWPVIGSGPNEWPIQKATLAMALRGNSPHRHLRQIHIRHWRRLAALTGAPDAFDQMVSMVDRAESALTSLEARLPAAFPEYVWQRIADGVRDQRTRFLDSVAAGQ
jgi:serine/threonine-protein kinase HipA